MYCTHCKRSGHEADFCFQLIGYPEWWGDRPWGEGWISGKSKGLPQKQPTGLGVGRGRGGAVRANADQTTTRGAGRTEHLAQ